MPLPEKKFEVKSTLFYRFYENALQQSYILKA